MVRVEARGMGVEFVRVEGCGFKIVWPSAASEPRRSTDVVYIHTIHHRQTDRQAGR